MAQLAYGSITITDTNDIESIIIEYARNQSTSNPPDATTGGWSTTRPAWAQGYYIWQRARIHKSGTDASADTFGTAVCITGSTGQTGGQGPQGETGAAGRSLTATETKYTSVASGTTKAQVQALAESNWSSNVPSYNSAKPDYWVRIVNTYDQAPLNETVYYKDQGLTDAVSKANDAWNKADQAQTDASNALSQANAANQATALLGGHFIYNAEWQTTNTPHSANVVQTILKNGVDVTTDPTKWDYNVHIGANGIRLRNNESVLSEWTSTALIFYQPGTSNKGIELTSSALKFYDSTGTTAQATFGGTQAVISGTINVYDGKIGNSEDSYWYIGNYLDYNQNNSAAIKSHGTAFIQLGDSSTWRVATNRIHSAWNDDSSTGNAFRLHFPVYNDKESVSKYWDVGMHLPLARTDKFLYIRNANSTQTLENLGNDLEDSGYNYWTYQFWVDGEGNVHAPGFFIGNSTTPIGGGAGTVAERLTQGYGSATQPVYFNSNGVPTNTTYTLNAAGAKGVDTSISASSTSINLPTSQAVAAFVEGKGYITSYVDEKVKVTNANTTKLWVTGTATSGTSTGTLSYDTNVYITTTSGTLHATTFDGTSFTGTAAKATADVDGNAIKTTYLKLSGGQVTGPVSFGSSVTIDEATIGDLVVNGNASFTNNINANTINGVAVGSSPKFTDNNTTYTFASGTNGFTVTPSGGTAQTVTVTPSISNNVTGSGTSGYLVKWNGTNTVTNGPALGSGTTKFLREDGTWVVPSGTGVTSVAASGNNGITISGSPITTNGTITIGLNLSTAINGLTEGSSNATRDDYIVAQYAGGGTSTTTYHRRKLSNIFAALNSSDITNALGYTPYNSSNPNGYTSNTGTVTSVKVQGSNGLTGSGTVTTSGTITLSHDDTSSQTSSSNSGRTYIQSVTLDDYGHVTGLSTATETVTNTHNTAYLYAGASNGTANAATTNGNTYLILVDGGTVSTRRKISGSGTVSVASDSNGNITVTGSAHPTTLPNPKTLTIRAYNSTSTTASYSDSTYYGGESSNTTISVASTNAVTNISSNNSGQLILTRADGSQSDPITVKITATTSDTAASADKLNISADAGSTSVPVYFPANTGLPTAVTSIAYSLLPTGTTASTVAIGNHSHGNITNGGDITASAPTIANGDQLVINDHSASKITNGPTFDGSTTTAFLTKAGTWATPAGTYTLPLAANGTRGGVQIGYTTSGKNYAVQLSSEKMYVNVPWENTTYSAGTGLSLSGTTFNHSNSVTAGTAGTSSATLSTNRTIAIPYVTYDAQGHITGSGTHTHTIETYPEAYLAWGGKNHIASFGPIDAGMIDVLGANRFAFLRPAGITVEYSVDNGSSWSDYGLTDVQKSAIFGPGGAAYLGKHSSNGTSTVNDQLRITISTGVAYIYTSLNKFAIYMSISGNTVWVKIEKALESTPTTYIDVLDWTSISGWSGWNIYNVGRITTYGNSASSQYGRIRFTFKQTAATSTYCAAGIWRIMGFGGDGWTVPSNMARDGHLYSYDASQNATFPAQVTATQFNGNATTATAASVLTALDANDIASSSATWRKVWFSYNDGATGRPALSNSFAYQASTNTLKVPHFLAEHISGGDGEFRVTYSSTVDMSMMIGTDDVNHGLYDHKARKWMIYADGNGNVVVNGNAATASAFSSNKSITLTGNTTGTASSTGGWSIATTTSYMTSLGRQTSANLSTPSNLSLISHMLASSSMTTAKPPAGDGYITTYHWDNSGWAAQFYLRHNKADPNPMVRGAESAASTSDWGDWHYILTDVNYSTYTVKKDGTGATGTWGISVTGNAATATKATQDGSGNTITSTYVKKTGDTMTGCLIVQTTSSYASYNEGIRINKGGNGYSTLLLGGTTDSTSGTNVGAWWIGVNNTQYARRLMIAHNGSGATGTYFYTNADATVTPNLRLGSSGTITSGNMDAVNGGTVYTAISNLSGTYVSLTGNEGILGVKVFGNGTSYGTVTNKTSYTAKANINYNSTLDALVFSFV